MISIHSSPFYTSFQTSFYFKYTSLQAPLHHPRGSLHFCRRGRRTARRPRHRRYHLSHQPVRRGVVLVQLRPVGRHSQRRRAPILDWQFGGRCAICQDCGNSTSPERMFVGQPGLVAPPGIHDLSRRRCGDCYHRAQYAVVHVAAKCRQAGTTVGTADLPEVEGGVQSDGWCSQFHPGGGGRDERGGSEHGRWWYGSGTAPGVCPVWK